MKEVWMPIVGYETIYSVSNIGRIRRDRYWHNTYCGRIIKKRVDNFGYEVVCLSNKNKVKLLKVHRIVSRAFIGKCPAGMNVNHKNRIKNDNRIGNLEYTTQSENILHAYRSGHKAARGMAHGMSKLTDRIVIKMRNLYKKGVKITDIARSFNINRLTVSDAVREITWKHI